MKRLFLLLVAMFVVATLQAQVMCYEYEYSYTETRKSGKKPKYTVESYSKKLYFAILKGSKKPLNIYPAAADGQYWTQNLLKPNHYYSFTFSYNDVDYHISADCKEIHTNLGFSKSRYYRLKRVFKAYNKATTIYESAAHEPKFFGDTSTHSFCEWFEREMPAQEVFNKVHSITIIIERDGSVTTEEINTDFSHNEQLKQQVSEVLARSPKWTPAYDNDGKTPLRYRMKIYDLFLRKTEARLAREAREAKERAEREAREDAERESYLRTPEGQARERQKIEDLCAQWGVGAFDRVICQSQGGANLGGITLEELIKRIRSASRPLVVITAYPACVPSNYLMQDLKSLLVAYEGQYDLYIVHLIPAVEAYHKALKINPLVPSVLFVYNGYGAYERRVGYDRSKQQELVTWFDQMMKKSAF